MTAVNWLLEELKKVHHPTEAMIMYANKMFEQQIIDAVNIDKRQYDNAQQYYTSTYGSKGSESNPCKEIPLEGYFEQVEWYREQLKQNLQNGK